MNGEILIQLILGWIQIEFVVDNFKNTVILKRFLFVY